MKRKCLLAHESSELREILAKQITSLLPSSQFYHSSDGMDARNKIANDPPQIAFFQDNLPKQPAAQLVDWTIGNPKIKLASVIIGRIPETSQFVDQVVTGQVQFLQDPRDRAQLAKVLARAFNFVDEKVDNEFHIRHLAAGDILLQEGETGQVVFILTKGSLRAQHQKAEGLQVLGQIHPGEFVGEMAYINGEPRSADVVAEEKCELIEIPMTLLDSVLYRKPAWGKALMKTLSQRVKRANERDLN